MSLYFDAAATTPLAPEVWQEMESVRATWGNASSRHAEGFRARAKMDEYLQRMADRLGTSPAHLVITHGGTEGNRRLVWAMRKRLGHENLFCSTVEHSSLRDEILESNQFDADAFQPLPKNPAFVSLMAGNNETGRIFDLRAVRKKFPKSFFFSDWVQAPGRLDFDFQSIDAATFSAHKFHGPKGVGLLWLRNPEEFPELSKDRHTKDLVSVAGMARAFELLTEKKRAHVAHQTEQIERFLEKNIPDIRIHQKNFPRVPGVINVAFRGVRGSELMTILSEREEVCVSTGAACTSDLLAPSHVIQTFEPDPEWQYPIRITLHFHLSDAEVSEFCEILAHYVGELRQKGSTL